MASEGGRQKERAKARPRQGTSDIRGPVSKLALTLAPGTDPFGLSVLCTVVGWHGVKEALQRLDEADEARTPPHSHHVVRQRRSFPRRCPDAP